MKKNDDVLIEEDELDFMNDEEDEANPLVTAGVFLALVAVAAIICVLLWTFTHRDKGAEVPTNVTETVNDELAESEIVDIIVENETEEGMVGETAENKVEDIVVTETDSMEETNSGDNGQAGGKEENAGGKLQEPISGNESMEFTEVTDTVTAKDVTNLRSVPSTIDAENVVSQLLNGDTIARTGVNEETGWSRLDYNGQTVYAVTQYLTTDLEYKTPITPSDPNRIVTQDGRIIIFVDCDDNVTPKEYVNLRVEPSTSQGEATVKCQISNGTDVHRTGHSPDSGWSRVEYDGEVLYVVSSMVVTVP